MLREPGCDQVGTQAVVQWTGRMREFRVCELEGVQWIEEDAGPIDIWIHETQVMDQVKPTSVGRHLLAALH